MENATKEELENIQAMFKQGYDKSVLNSLWFLLKLNELFFTFK